MMKVDFANFDLREIFGKPCLTEIEIEYFLWVDFVSAFED